MCAVGCSARAADSCERAERQRGAPFPDRSSRVRRAGVGSGAGPGRWDRSLRRVGRGAWPGGELGGERAAPRAGAGTAQPASLGQPAGGRWAVPQRGACWLVATRPPCHARGRCGGDLALVRHAHVSLTKQIRRAP